MAIQLSSSYLRRSFQILVKLDPEKLTNDEAFERASNIIYEWAKQKFSSIFRQMPYQKASFDSKRDGNEIGIIYNPDKHKFIFRGMHPDAEVPGRMWITDAQLCKNGNNCIFGVRLSVTSLQSSTENVPFSCPAFIPHIIDHIGISDVIRIENHPHLLSTSDDVDNFITFLENPQRRMPAILLTPCHHIADSICNGYMMDAIQMSRDLLGIAHVFQITEEANNYLSDRIGKQWSAFNGTVRTYYPDISFDGSDYYQHPLLTQQSIHLRSITENTTANFCMQEIEDSIKKRVAAQRILWDKENVQFYLAAYQDYLQEQQSYHESNTAELIASYRAQLDQLKQQCDENKEYADACEEDNENYRKINEEQRQKINRLKAHLTTLRFQLKTSTGEAFEPCIPDNASYLDISEWIDQNFPDRLFLHSRAARSLKDAIYEDTKLVYKCLHLLATSYYDYRTGLINYDAFTDACKMIDAGLNESGAITDVSAGMQGETYYIQYQGRQRKLERHLAKGNNKDRRYCLRIYFFWDDQDQIVVIGDLPHHLDTRAT